MPPRKGTPKDLSAHQALVDDVWTSTVHAFGTGYIFEQRANRLRLRLQILNFVSFVVPVMVGGLVLTYGTKLAQLPAVVSVMGAVGLVQVVVSLWALVAGWVETYGYALRSMEANNALAREYEILVNSAFGASEMSSRFVVLRGQDKVRQAEDGNQGVTEREKRLGMRAALRRYQKPCAGCHKVPVDMKSTACGVCGDFSVWTTQRWGRS